MANYKTEQQEISTTTKNFSMLRNGPPEKTAQRESLHLL
uniref:Uncharacterized protein n=1 Tax=Anguilla anguilla TaxID=7936 RepID=A0A0E9UPG7_ANGAN